MLCWDKPLVCRKPPPPYGFSIILRHTRALPVIVPERVLGKRIPLHGRAAVPLERFAFIFWQPAATVVQETQVELRFGIPLLGAGA
jgi:hypothetical protein